MKIYTPFIALFFLLCSFSFAQQLSEKQAYSFIKGLISESDSLTNYFDPSKISISKRLGITYKGIKFKELISSDIEPDIKNEILNNNLSYTFSVDSLDEDYSKLTLKLTS